MGKRLKAIVELMAERGDGSSRRWSRRGALFGVAASSAAFATSAVAVQRYTGPPVISAAPTVSATPPPNCNQSGQLGHATWNAGISQTTGSPPVTGYGATQSLYLNYPAGGYAIRCDGRINTTTGSIYISFTTRPTRQQRETRHDDDCLDDGGSNEECAYVATTTVPATDLTQIVLTAGQTRQAEPGPTLMLPVGGAIYSALAAGRTIGIEMVMSDQRRMTAQLVFADIPPALAQGRSVAATLPGRLQSGQCQLATGCYLTTAAVDVVGLADDCWELRTLRGLRDRMLDGSKDRRALVAHYYLMAPEIVRRISARPGGRRIWLTTYAFGILPAAAAAHLRLTRLAQVIYVMATRRLDRLAA